MAKTKPIEISKTDIKAVMQELTRARGLYQEMRGLRASCRVYVIDNLMRKLDNKLKNAER